MFSRRTLLGSSLSAGLLGWTPRAVSAPSGRPMRLITVLCWGGWDVTLCADPKPGVAGIEDGTLYTDLNNPEDREVLQQFGNIPIMTNAVRRPSVTEFFENHHHRTCVVNGIWTGSLAHEPSRYRMLTGMVAGGSPDINVMVGAAHGALLPLGSIDLSGHSFSGQLAASTGRVGANSQILTLLDGTRSFPAIEGAPHVLPQFNTTAAQYSAMRKHLLQRESAERQRWTDGGANDLRFDSLREGLDRSDRLVKESDLLLNRLRLGTVQYGLDSMILAVDLLETGMCQTVMVNSGELWDTHRGNSAQNGCYESTFQRINQMLSELEVRGMMEDTVVAIVSEMTRTPRHNAVEGKDHWPHASAILVGGAVQGDRVCGATDDLLESMTVDLRTGEPFAGGALNRCENFCAGVLELCDVDPTPHFPGVEPFRGVHLG